MRNYVPCWEKIGISKERYLELLHYCRQYDQWRRDAASLVGIRGMAMDGQPHGSGIGDPVFAAVERRNAIISKVQLVERCALAVDGGIWFNALVENVCRAKPYNMIDPVLMPTSNKSAFFQARKKFFLLINEAREMPKEG